jgi:hypothetical protein
VEFRSACAPIMASSPVVAPHESRLGSASGRGPDQPQIEFTANCRIVIEPQVHPTENDRAGASASHRFEPTKAGRDVIGALGPRLPRLLALEVVQQDELGLAGRPFPSSVPEIADQLFRPPVDRDDRPVGFERLAPDRADRHDLGITIGMLMPVPDLHVRLRQAYRTDRSSFAAVTYSI